MNKANGYSLEVVCRPFQLCTFNVYAPGANKGFRPGDYAQVEKEDYDSRFQPGFGAPVVRMRGMSVNLPPEEAALNPRISHSDTYNSHRLYSRHAATADTSATVSAANRFLEVHDLVGDITIDAERIGDLGYLALGGEQAEQSELFVPSPALAMAMGQLPMHAAATLER